MLERRNCILWESRFRRFLDNKLKDGDRMWNSIQNGPYVRSVITNPDDIAKQILEPFSKMTKGNKKQYIADVKVMNYLLQAIPNYIYNLVDSCKNAKDMWERIKRLMFSFDITGHVRHSRLMDMFNMFAAKEGESLESVYEILTTLVNIMDHNNVRPILVSINTKFLNFVDYEDDYQGELQGDSQEDKLTTAMILLARTTTQKFSTPTNNHLRTPSNTRNQAMVQDGRVDIQTKNTCYRENGNRNARRQNRNQAFNAGTRNNERSQIVQHVSRTESTLGKENVQCYNYNEKSHYARDFQKLRVYDANPSTSNNGSKSKEVTSNLPIPKMPKEKNELLRAELEKSSSDSKDIQANLLKQIKILENDFKRSQAQSIDFELKLQHQKEKIACDVSWKSKLSTINDENVLLETQVDYVVKVRENIKLEYKKLFKSIKVTRTQHKKELDELIEHVNQKTYAYADVHAQNQDLSITISELKNKLQTVDMGKTVNTKFDKFEASRTLLYVTPLPKHIWLRLRKCQILRNSSVKRALFTTLIAGKSKNLGATSIVSKSRLSVAKTAIATNKVSSVLPLSSDSSQSRTLSNYMKNKIATSRKWQKWFKTQQCFNWTPKSKTAQSLPSETKSQIRVRSTSNTLVTTQKWVAKMSTLSSMFVSYDAGDPARPLGC
nr:hypothetical protein [Tanacetum cinerariifolium]